MDDAALPRTPSRRRFLVGGVAAVVLGGGAGAATALLTDRAPAPPPLPPRALHAAIAAEWELLADLHATTGGTPDVRRVIVAARRDHAAHLAALTRMLAGYRGPTASLSPAPRGTPRTRAQLRTAEQQAATAAARHAGALSGGLAALLASIAACEATHAELLA